MHTRSRFVCVAGAYLGVAAACTSEPTAPPAEVVSEVGPIVTFDRVSYSWTVNDSARWLMANPHGVPAFYYPGNHAFLEHYVGDTWEPIGLYGGIEAEPRRLAVSDSLRDNLSLTSSIFSVSGWYRLHANLYRDSALMQPWPVGNQVSPAVWVGP